MSHLKCAVRAVAKTIADLQQGRARRVSSDVIEALEPRVLLATSIYDATNNADVIRVRSSGSGANRVQEVDINGVVNLAPHGNSVVVRALDGADTIYIEAIAATITISGDAGNDNIYMGLDPDHLNAGGNIGSIDTIFGVLVTPGSGTDTFTVNDSAGTSDIGVGSASVAGVEFGGSPNLDLPETLSIVGSTSGASYSLAGQPAQSMTVTAGAGSDTFAVGAIDEDILAGKFNSTAINGGGGSNSVTFDDYAGTLTQYSLTGNVFAANGTAISLIGLQTIDIDVASTNNTVVLNSSSAANINVHVNFLFIFQLRLREGQTALTVGDGFLSDVSGDVSFDGVATDSVIINDSLNAGAEAYAFSPAIPLTITPTPGNAISVGSSQVTLNAGTGNDTFNLPTVQNQGVGISGGGGNDAFNVGSGNLDLDVTQAITVAGGAGSDTLTLDDSADAVARTQTLSSSTFSDGTRSFDVTDLDVLRVEEGSGGESINLNSVPVATTINGGAGAEVVSIGNGDLDSNLSRNVVINGNAGTNTIVVNDGAATSDGSYTFNAGVFKKGVAGKTITVGTVEGDTLDCGRGNDTITITGVTYPLTILSGNGNDSISANTSSDVTFSTGNEGQEFGSFGDTISVNPGGTGAAVMTVFHSDSVASVSTAVGGKLVVESNFVLINTHDLSNTGAIDLSGGALIVNGAASQLTQYQTWLKAGYASGAWNGTSTTINKVVTPGAINSALAAQDHTHFAVGFAPASAIFNTFPASFAGQSVTSTAMLARYTTVGDANLDGKTNALDFNALATNFGSASADWYQGDFNYDGKVNTTDFTALATNFNASLPSAAPLAAIESSMPTAGAQTSRTDLFGKKAIGDRGTHDDLLATSV